MYLWRAAAKQRPPKPPPTITIPSSWCIFSPVVTGMCPFSLSAINDVQGKQVGFVGPIESDPKNTKVFTFTCTQTSHYCLQPGKFFV